MRRRKRWRRSRRRRRGKEMRKEMRKKKMRRQRKRGSSNGGKREKRKKLLQAVKRKEAVISMNTTGLTHYSHSMTSALYHIFSQTFTENLLPFTKRAKSDLGSGRCIFSKKPLLKHMR